MKVNKKDFDVALYNEVTGPQDGCKNLLDYLNTNPIIIKELVTYDEFKQGGKDFYRGYCPFCGDKPIFDKKMFNGWGSSHFDADAFPCDCDKSSLITKNPMSISATMRDDGSGYSWYGRHTYNEDNFLYYVKKPEKFKIFVYDVDNDKETFKWVLFIPLFTHQGKKVEECDPESFDWLEGDWKATKVEQYAKGFYSNDMGFYGSNADVKSTQFGKWLKIFIEPKIDIICETPVTFLGDIKNDVEQKNIDLQKIKEEKAASSNKKLSEEKAIEEIENYSPKICNGLVRSVIDTYLDYPLAVEYSRSGNKRRFLMYCPKCGKVEVVDEGTDTCPSCGFKFSKPLTQNYFYGERQAFNYVTIIWEKLPNGYLVQRMFESTGRLNDTEEKFDYSCKEKYRFYFTENKSYLYVVNGGTASRSNNIKSYDISYRYYYRDKVFAPQNPQDIKDMIEDSIFKYSGFIDALGLSTQYPDRKISSTCVFGTSCYLYKLYKNKTLEQILKAGLFNVARQIESELTLTQVRSIIKNSKATTVTEALGITKPVLRIAREVDASIDELKVIEQMWTADQTLDTATYKDLMSKLTADCDKDYYSTGTDASRCFTLITLKKDFNISYKEAIEYMENVWENQCIPYSETLGLWKDYLRMAKAMTYRLNNRNIKFPQSLKLEHDRAVFTNKAIVDEGTREKFHENAEKNEQYSYHLEELFVKIPHEPEEIIQEGVDLKHCVASYVNAVTDGATCIAFIRTKQEPENSLYTAEVKNGVITEVKGYANEAPTDPVVIEFVNKWAKFKGLTVGCGL